MFALFDSNASSFQHKFNFFFASKKIFKVFMLGSGSYTLFCFPLTLCVFVVVDDDKFKSMTMVAMF